MPFAGATRGLAPTHYLHHLKVSILSEFLQADPRDLHHLPPGPSHLPDCPPNCIFIVFCKYLQDFYEGTSREIIYLYVCVHVYITP